MQDQRVESLKGLSSPAPTYSLKSPLPPAATLTTQQHHHVHNDDLRAESRAEGEARAAGEGKFQTAQGEKLDKERKPKSLGFQSGGEDYTLSEQRVQIQSLVCELRSHRPQREAKKKIRKKLKINPRF